MEDLRTVILTALIDAVKTNGLDFGKMATVAAERVEDYTRIEKRWIFDLNEGR